LPFFCPHFLFYFRIFFSFSACYEFKKGDNVFFLVEVLLCVEYFFFRWIIGVKMILINP
jgi:hypothetical protein